MNLKGRSFLKILDFTPEEISYLLDFAAELKAEKKALRKREKEEKKLAKQKELLLAPYTNSIIPLINSRQKG